MAANRGDDLVIAGMRPPSFGNTSSPFDPVHRGTTFILFIDSLILLYFLNSFFSNFAPSLLTVGLGSSAALLTINWLAYRRKSTLVYWIAPGIIGFASLIFLFSAILSLISGSLLFAFLLFWACFGSFRRVLTHVHPG